MSYNLTNLTDAEGFSDIAVELNILAEPTGLFSVFLLMAIFFITMAVANNYDIGVKLTLGSFASLIFSIILFIIGMVSEVYMVVCLVLLIGSILYNVWR